MTARQDLSHGASVTPIDYQDRYTMQPRKGWLRRNFIRILLIVGVFSVVGSLFLGSMCGAREPANRIKCGNNLRQIALGAVMYAADHGGMFPSTVQELFATEELGKSVFSCPSDRNVPASSSAQLGASYVYLGAGLRPDVDHPETAVLAYEPLSNHSNDGMEVHLEALADHRDDGMNVAFADAHVVWISAPDVGPILKQAAAGVRPIRFSSGAATQP